MFGQKWIEVDPKDYLFRPDSISNDCFLFIVPAEVPMNILGMPLFVDYYTIHDPLTG